MNWWLIALRAQGPAVALVVGTLALGEVFDRLAQVIPGQGGAAASIAFYLPLAGAVVAGLWWIAVWRRLKAWEAGRAPECRRCSGPLGLVARPGKTMYGRQLPDFYRCWNCGKATPAE